MQIIVALTNFCRRYRDIMNDVRDGLSVVHPKVDYATGIIKVKQNIKIQFLPAINEKIKGRRPDFYYTDSYYVNHYFAHCNSVKELATFNQLTNVVLKEYIRQNNITDKLKSIPHINNITYPHVCRCDMDEKFIDVQNDYDAFDENEDNKC